MILLVNMPFGSLCRPSLPLSQFKAQFTAAGIASRLVNLNFPFARRIGVDLFEQIAQRRGVDAQVGEWLFARDAWRGEVDAPLECCCDHALADRTADLNRIRDEIVPDFLETSCNQLLADESVRIVAFSCAFFQTLPSLALARRIKQRAPGVTLLFGGSNFHGDMGEELLARTGWIDVVATSEADDLIVGLCRRILEGENLDGIEGIAQRTPEGGVCSRPRSAPVLPAVLDALPDPDYSDFIEDLSQLDGPEAAVIRERTYLPFEGSRGCWWGEKSHCTFCGLNPTGLAFRARSPERVLATIENMVRAYPIRRFFATDNNMPLDFLQGLWPQAAERGITRTCQIFYEVKPNLTRDQVRLLADAGVRFLQPGIETLSTHLLRCMRKGLSGLTHVYFLKLCRQCNVWPAWNFLVGIPGERDEDYRELARLVPLIRHFTPPQTGIQPLQLHRYSVYHTEADRYLEHFAPSPWYASLFPAQRIDLKRIAYYFDADWKDTLGAASEDYPELAEAVQNWVDTWLEAPQLPALALRAGKADGLDILDTRFGKTGLWSLDARESAVYRVIDDPATPADVVANSGGQVDTSAQAETILNEFVQAGLAIQEAGRYLGLALPDSIPEASPAERRQFLAKARRQQSKRAAAGASA